LEPGDLRLAVQVHIEVVMKRVAVVKLGVNNGSGDGGICFGIYVWMDRAKLTNMVIASNMKPRFRAEWVVVSEEL